LKGGPEMLKRIASFWAKDNVSARRANSSAATILT
jgi:hypothetical protein